MLTAGVRACTYTLPSVDLSLPVERAGANKQQFLMNQIQMGRDLQAAEASAHSSPLVHRAPDQTGVRASFVPAFPLREPGDFQADGRHNDSRLGKKSS